MNIMTEDIMAEKDWERSKLKPDAMDEYLEQQYGRLVPEVLDKIGKKMDEVKLCIQLFPDVEWRFKGYVSTIIALLYPGGKEVCLAILDATRDVIEKKVKNEEE